VVPYVAPLLYAVQASYRGEDTEAEEAGGEDTAVTEFVKSLESKARGRLIVLSTHKNFVMIEM
jgi:hypothetical protein